MPQTEAGKENDISKQSLIEETKRIISGYYESILLKNDQRGANAIRLYARRSSALKDLCSLLREMESKIGAFRGIRVGYAVRKGSVKKGLNILILFATVKEAFSAIELAYDSGFRAQTVIPKRLREAYGIALDGSYTVAPIDLVPIRLGNDPPAVDELLEDQLQHFSKRCVKSSLSSSNAVTASGLARSYGHANYSGRYYQENVRDFKPTSGRKYNNQEGSDSSSSEFSLPIFPVGPAEGVASSVGAMSPRMRNGYQPVERQFFGTRPYPYEMTDMRYFEYEAGLQDYYRNERQLYEQPEANDPYFNSGKRFSSKQTSKMQPTTRAESLGSFASQTYGYEDFRSEERIRQARRKETLLNKWWLSVVEEQQLKVKYNSKKLHFASLSPRKLSAYDQFKTKC